MKKDCLWLLLPTLVHPYRHRVSGFKALGTRHVVTTIHNKRAGNTFENSFTKRQQTHSSIRLWNNNPFRSMLDDMASSLFSSIREDPQVDQALKDISEVADWTSIRKSLEIMQTPLEREFRSNLAKGYGVGSPLHLVRLFDEKNTEEDIRVTFYRDSASWCPYCQKVWLTLEEKQIPYRVEKINMRCYGDKPQSFLRIQPGGQIPVAIIDGVTFGQSNDILFALEEKFQNHKSMQPPASLKAKAQEYFRLERQLFSAWMYWLTGRSGQQVAKAEFIETLNLVEAALKTVPGSFFLGNDITLVDVQFTPFLERMAASLLFYKGFQIRFVDGSSSPFPAINKWFDAMETLPSYQLTKSDYYTHNWDLPPQLGGCTDEPGGKRFQDAINGLKTLDGTQGSWELPLQPHNGGVEPDWEWAGDENAARREAVERVSGNSEAIVKFAARGAGKRGRSYGAPLSDPNAVPNEAVLQGVDSMLRVVCLALLNKTENYEETIIKVADTVVKKGGKDYAQGVVASLTYVRDRIGVPRDMKLPAARQLRAHLNWAIGKLLDALDS